MNRNPFRLSSVSGSFGLRGRVVILLLGVVLGCIFAAPAFKSQMFDDAYIHARLARNIEIQGVPAFNAGDKVKIGSSTGYVYLIHALSSVFNWSHISSIRAIEVVAVFFTVLGFFAFLAVSGVFNIALASAAFLASFPFFLHAAYGGMETPVVCMLIIFAVVAHKFDRYGLVIILLSLATWFRFESILLIGLGVLYYGVSGKVSKKVILLCVAPFVALVVFEVHIFGTVFPHAAKVKQVAYGFPPLVSLYNAMSFGQGKISVVVGLLFLMSVAGHCISVFYLKKDTDLGDVLIVFSVGVFCAWVIGRSLIFPWYFCLLSFPFGIGLFASHRLGIKGGSLRGWWVPLVAYYLSLVAAFGVAALGFYVLIKSYGPDSKDNPLMRVQRYAEIGAALHRNCPDCSLLTSEIGGLGYSFDGVVYDGFGLGDPVASRYHPMKVPEDRQGYGVGAIPVDYARYRNPDYIVSMPVFSYSLRTSDFIRLYFKYNCPIGRSSSVSIFGDSVIEVYSRRDIPVEIVHLMGCFKV